MRKKFALGVTLFGLYFIIDSCFQLYIKLLSPGYYDWYSSVFQPLPVKIIYLRYILSIIFRMIEFAFGLGIIYRKEASRRAAVFMSWFTIAIVYWKHPVNAFSRHAQNTVDNIYPATSCQLTPSAYAKIIPWISLAAVYAIDIGISALAIYYFTRPRVKEEFKR